MNRDTQRVGHLNVNIVQNASQLKLKERYMRMLTYCLSVSSVGSQNQKRKQVTLVNMLELIQEKNLTSVHTVIRNLTKNAICFFATEPTQEKDLIFVVSVVRDSPLPPE